MSAHGFQKRQANGVLRVVALCGVVFALAADSARSVAFAAQNAGGQPSQRRTAQAGGPAKPTAPATVEDLASSIIGVKLRVDGNKVIISHVRRGGQADRSGIRPGDQLTSIEKHKIASLNDVLSVLQHFKPGQGVVMTVIPSTAPRQLYMAPPAQQASSPRPGNAMLGATLNDASGGVVVGQLSIGGPAVVGGLRSGDKLLSIDGQKFKSKQQLMAYIDHAHAGDRVDIAIQRDGWQRTLLVTLGARDQVASLPKMTVPPAQQEGSTSGGATTSTYVDDGDEWADEKEAVDMYNVNDRALYTDFD